MEFPLSTNTETVYMGRGYYNVRLTLLEGLNRLLQRQAARGAVV